MTGYRGRVGIFELLSIDQPIHQLIQSRATAAQIRDAAVASGTRTLRDDGVEKILAGQTTISEVERVTGRAEAEGE
jgi:type II secretory ATPase GspE/PulE/Tfp pilus assembly ATPase PilB-like protein